jgi:hypothetical protein
MSQILKGTESIVQGGLQFGEASTKTLQGVTGIGSPIFGLVSDGFKTLAKLLGGAFPRRSARLSRKAKINSPKRSKRLSRAVVHSRKPGTTSKSPRRQRK